jgi:hypothetical protein
MATSNAAQTPKYHPTLYATSLKIANTAMSLLLDVEAATPQQAAEVAANEWLGCDRPPDIGAGAALYVRPYLLDGTVELETLVSLGRQSLEQTRGKWAKRAIEAKKHNDEIENCRRQAIARMKQHLAHAQIAEAELEGLRSAFENGSHDHPELKASVTLESPSFLTGLGGLQFRTSAVQASRAVGYSGGDDAGEHWLAILVGYLLENDKGNEYITTQPRNSRTGNCGEKITEIYWIAQLFKASVLCCSWLNAVMPGSKGLSGKTANGDAAPADHVEGAQTGGAWETGPPTGENDPGIADPDAKRVRRARAETVAKLIEELNTLKPQMFEDEREYNLLQTRYSEFLTFKIAKDRPDLKTKVQCIRGSARHIRLAQEIAAAHYGKSRETIADAWKDHKPPQYKRPGASGKHQKSRSARPTRQRNPFLPLFTPSDTHGNTLIDQP